MADFKYKLIGAAFELLWASQLTRLIRRQSKARGVIFTLHRVLPEDPADFSPNAILQVKPDFLEYTIMRVRQLGFEIVDLDEAARRIEADEPAKPFVAFTFDDAYRDNLRYALPIMRRQQCPFTIYVPTALVDGVGEVWWQALEDIIAAQNALAVTQGGETEYYATANLGEKHRAYDSLYHRMRTMPEADRVKLIRELAEQYGLDLQRHCRELIMDWSELRLFANEPLCTIGAHGVHHYELAKLSPQDARNEIEQSLRILKAQFGKAPIHLSYPIGGTPSAGPREYTLARELGLRTAVTTRPGGLYAGNRYSLHSLPRVSLNGLFQQKRHVDVFATPALFSLVAR
ncbi:polysaccharide deacetylase family protein [Devosia sp. ZB163]|uniref:polysaccharide deacetylase family protein n=1 Tax=Devosia sp. ZB163 TaxID=3025938 RepID=UPI00235E7642|nr:polysaccharide deacetylase family protein [Devosia sp. ZB163]MDC9824316.1 polysaccharide deacetylase family protein [Devosia sp. ZB163]